MNASHRDRCPGGLEGELEVSRGVEDDRDRRNVVEGTECDGICHRSEESGVNVETNAPGRDKGPGGSEGDHDTMGDVESNSCHKIDRKCGRKRGATSDPRCESK